MKPPRVWIEELHLRGYRSCISTALRPRPELSVLIGPNGSGKTNILQGILLLKQESRRRYGLISQGRPLRTSILVKFRVGKFSIPYRATIDYVTDNKNQNEIVAAFEEWNFSELTKKDRWDVIPSSDFVEEEYYLSKHRPSSKRIGHRPFSITLGDPYSVLPKSVHPVFSAISNYRRRISYYSASQFTNPGNCPSSIEIDEDGDLRNGGGQKNSHLKFLFDLYACWKAEEKSYEQYISIVGKNGIGLIDSVSWKSIKVASSNIEVKSGGKVVKQRRERRIVIPSVTVSGSQLSFNQLSEGSFKTLALVFYLVTDRSGLLLVEEPEVCVHHGLLASVIETIKSFARDKQILCSTHSDFVLDSLLPEEIFSVQNSVRRGTIVKGVTEGLSKGKLMALKAYLKSSGNLGDYWKQGGLDG